MKDRRFTIKKSGGVYFTRERIKPGIRTALFLTNSIADAYTGPLAWAKNRQSLFGGEIVEVLHDSSRRGSEAYSEKHYTPEEEPVEPHNYL